MIINTNISALNSARSLQLSTSQLARSLARLSSGSRIISPEDDAAGLAQSIKFDAQTNRNQAALANLGNAISFSQTQDGFLQKVQKSVDRMSELAILAQDQTKTDIDRENYNAEFGKHFDFIFDIGGKQFNQVNLFGSSGLPVTIDSDGNVLDLNAIDVDSDVTFNLLTESVDTLSNAQSALTATKLAIEGLAKQRANVGANITRLTLTSEALTILNENLSAANSRLKDVDVAAESTQFARYNILVQSGTAMLAQANAHPGTALRLLE